MSSRSTLFALITSLAVADSFKLLQAPTGEVGKVGLEDSIGRVPAGLEDAIGKIPINVLIVTSAKGTSAEDGSACDANVEVDDLQVIDALGMSEILDQRSALKGGSHLVKRSDWLPRVFLGGKTMIGTICKAMAAADRNNGSASFNISSLLTSTAVRFKLSPVLTEEEVAISDVIFMSRTMEAASEAVASENMAMINKRRNGTQVVVIDRTVSQTSKSHAAVLATTTVRGTEVHLLKVSPKHPPLNPHWGEDGQHWSDMTGHPLFGNNGLQQIDTTEESVVAFLFSIIFYNPLSLTISCSNAWSTGQSFFECPPDEFEHCLKCPAWVGCHKCGRDQL